MNYKLPISRRLLTCASFVRAGSRVADIGTDHGYLAIHLLREEIAAHVAACDLREQPLAKARANAEKFDISDRIEFHCADGLAAVEPVAVDTVVCAGMGGDCIIEILTAAPWLKDGKYRLILQPQTSGQALRAYLSGEGFAILRETLVDEAGFLYTVLEAQFTGEREVLSPGAQYVSAALLRDASPLLGYYFERLCSSLSRTVEGLRGTSGREERKAYYETALREVTEMRERYGNGE
ncbi:MAG: SAM-dependent methyltransferase [Oscillospiraceae bacterium]|nr:SAM-dependent methyltransferase [Oscillospiraceae bacterium]